MDYDVAIIGGGASGLALAAFLGGCTAEKCRKLDICVIEGGARLGKKLSSTGNGQGNVGNTSVCPHNYHSVGDKICASDMAYGIIARSQNIHELLFEGVFSADDKGRIYPAGRQASALTDCLIAKLAREGVATIVGVKVASVKKVRRHVCGRQGTEAVRKGRLFICAR